MPEIAAWASKAGVGTRGLIEHALMSCCCVSTLLVVVLQYTGPVSTGKAVPEILFSSQLHPIAEGETC